jgi:hypothetical protein
VTTRCITDPHQTRGMTGRIDVHAQIVHDGDRSFRASAHDIAGRTWRGKLIVASPEPRWDGQES